MVSYSTLFTLSAFQVQRMPAWLCRDSLCPDFDVRNESLGGNVDASNERLYADVDERH